MVGEEVYGSQVNHAHTNNRTGFYETCHYAVDIRLGRCGFRSKPAAPPPLRGPGGRSFPLWRVLRMESQVVGKHGLTDVKSGFVKVGDISSEIR